AFGGRGVGRRLAPQPAGAGLVPGRVVRTRPGGRAELRHPGPGAGGGSHQRRPGCGRPGEGQRAGARVASVLSGVWSEWAAEVTSAETPVKSPRDRNT